MNKRIISVLLGTFMICCFAACGGKAGPESGAASASESLNGPESGAASASESLNGPESGAASASESLNGPSDEVPMSGGWTLTDQEAVTLPEEVQTAFSRIAEGKNDDLVPVALTAQQVVAGTNDMILCKSGSEYRMIVVYRNLQGGAELTNSTVFPLEDYTNRDGEAETEQLSGGWYAPEETTVLPLSEDAQKAFDNALENFDGSTVDPMALLGTQVVAGTNYAILCRVTPAVPDAVSSVMVVTVYADLQGNAEFTGFCPIYPADFNR